MEEPREQRIKDWMGRGLVITALCIDLAEFGITWIGILVVGSVLSELLSIMAWVLFWIWFLVLGVSMSANTKRFAVSIITVIVEIIPGFDAIPLLSYAWTVGMITTVGMVRMEDRGEEPTILGGILEFFTYGSFFTPTFVVRRAQNLVGKIEKPLREVFAAKKINQNLGEIKNELKIPKQNILNLKNTAPEKPTASLEPQPKKEKPENNHFAEFAERHENYRRAGMLDKFKK